LEMGKRLLEEASVMWVGGGGGVTSLLSGQVAVKQTQSLPYKFVPKRTLKNALKKKSGTVAEG